MSGAISRFCCPQTSPTCCGRSMSCIGSALKAILILGGLGLGIAGLSGFLQIGSFSNLSQIYAIPMMYTGLFVAAFWGTQKIIICCDHGLRFLSRPNREELIAARREAREELIAARREAAAARRETAAANRVNNDLRFQLIAARREAAAINEVPRGGGVREAAEDASATAVADARDIELTQGSIPELFKNVFDRFQFAILEGSGKHASLICPISLNFFQIPVVDKCGHTFERRFIKEHFRFIGEICPINRQALKRNELNLNLFVKNKVEEIISKSPILLPPSDLQTDNRKNADHCVKLSQKYVKDNNYEVALVHLSDAFKHSNSSEVFGSLPPLYEAFNQPLKAVFAYLYLAKLQLNENIPAAAIVSVDSALRLAPTDQTIQAIRLRLG